MVHYLVGRSSRKYSRAFKQEADSICFARRRAAICRKHLYERLFCIYSIHDVAVSRIALYDEMDEALLGGGLVFSRLLVLRTGGSSSVVIVVVVVFVAAVQVEVVQVEVALSLVFFITEG